MKDESTDLTQSELTVIDAGRRNGKEFGSIDFWLQFPIDLRPLKFIPGRNRKEKKTFQTLAGQAERGTVTKGNLKRLQGMLKMFQSLGIAKVAGSEGDRK